MIRTLIIFLLIVSAVACGARQENISEQKEMASIKKESLNENADQLSSSEATDEEQDLSPEVLSSLAAKAIQLDSMHKFVKTAHLNFRTKNVIETSLGIEKLVHENAGFIETSEIRSEEKENHLIPVDKDFNKEIRKYTTVSSITLRVPSDKLNSFLLQLQPFVVYLGHRNVTSTNIAFDQYLKKLIQNRISVHSLRVLNTSKNKASDLDQLLEREMQSDRELVEEMKLGEQVAYSTVHLQVYGPDQVSISRVPAIDMNDYQPGVGSSFLAALIFGWGLIMKLLIGLTAIWPVLLAGAIVWIVLKRRRSAKKNS